MKLATTLGGLALAAACMNLGPFAELARISEPSGGLLDMAARADGEQVSRHLTAIGERGRALYARHFWFDLGFLLGNAVLLWSLLRLAAGGLMEACSVRYVLLALPWVAALLDLVENVAIRALVFEWTAPSPGWVTIARISTEAKLALLPVIALSLVIVGATRVVRRFASPGASQPADRPTAPATPYGAAHKPAVPDKSVRGTGSTRSTATVPHTGAWWA